MTPTSNRRIFIGRLVASGGMAVASRAFAQGGAHVAETDEQAVALGYRQDSAQVDGAKYPKHTAAQHCGNCSFWQGKPDDAWAGCAMFGRKQVAQGGWCQVWAKVPG